MLAEAGKSAIEGLRAGRLAFWQVIGLRTRRQEVLSLLTLLGEARIILFCLSQSQEKCIPSIGISSRPVFARLTCQGICRFASNAEIQALTFDRS